MAGTGSSLDASKLSSGGWIHISAGTAQDKVAGPFTGDGLFQLLTAGIHVYPSQKAAAAAPSQNLTQSQADTVAQVIGEGPGIGQGFFGLSGNVSSAVQQASGLWSVGHWIGELVSHLTDIHMWISIGWLALGLLLLITGIMMLGKNQLAGGLPGVLGALA
jgi:hypothetical protein